MLDALHSDLGVAEESAHEEAQPGEERSHAPSVSSRRTLPDLEPQWSTISTLDPTLDAALRGGIPTGCVTEIAGEAGAGKTQLLLSLLLAVQLAPPHGTGRRALYISTEAPLSTRRLTQMLAHNPLLASLPTDLRRPSLDDIISTTTPDLESQEHILTYQVPVEVARRDVGLVVLDSVAANYRAEFDRGGSGSGMGQGSSMGARSAELVRLGMLLRDLARSHNLAVVVSNQVADRFGASSPLVVRSQPTATQNNRHAAAYAAQRHAQESPLAARSRNLNQPPLPPVEPTSSIADALPRSSLSYGGHEGEEEEEEDGEPFRPVPAPPPPPPYDEVITGPPALSLDHQQRWFTGWGDDRRPAPRGMKTPSLGLVWATQVGCRIAVFKAPRYGRSRYAADEDEDGGGGVGGVVPTLRTWRRWAKVVFAPHVAPMGPGLEGAAEFEIGMGGVKGVAREARR